MGEDKKRIPVLNYYRTKIVNLAPTRSRKNSDKKNNKGKNNKNKLEKD